MVGFPHHLRTKRKKKGYRTGKYFSQLVKYFRFQMEKKLRSFIFRAAYHKTYQKEQVLP
jgi:hypothetical protein